MDTLISRLIRPFKRTKPVLPVTIIITDASRPLTYVDIQSRYAGVTAYGIARALQGNPEVCIVLDSGDYEYVVGAMKRFGYVVAQECPRNPVLYAVKFVSPASAAP